VYWLGTFATNSGPLKEDDVAITPRIQAEINESARDLFQSMKSVAVLYANQIEAFQSEFNKM
jgi:hypothetical protein